MRSEIITTPFTILIDSCEKQPFTFHGIHADADKQSRPLLVQTRYAYLGAGCGDYTIESCQGRIALERKSAVDLYGTVLGFKKRRDRFERELANLSSMEFAAVVIEASMMGCLDNPPDFGEGMEPEVRAKVLYRSIISWMLRFPKVQWIFCDSRRVAEVTAFRLLEKFHKHDVLNKKAQAKELETQSQGQPQGVPSHVDSTSGF